jgi:hypothetical protein
MLTLYEIIGLTGLVIEASGFFMLQKRLVRESSWLYLLSIFFGTGMIIYSLMYSWNLASAIWNITWNIYALYSIIRIKLLKLDVIHDKPE